MKKIVFLALSFFAAATLVAANGLISPGELPSGQSAGLISAPVIADLDLSGKWDLVADTGGQQVEISLDLVQKGSTFTGTSSSTLGDGKIDGGKVIGSKFSCTLHADLQGQPVDFTMEGSVDKDKMVGSFANPSFGSIPFTAVKKK